jgi:hypothetical protein
MMSEEYGPWIDHDGKSCPNLVGHILQCVVRRDEDTPPVVAGNVDLFASAPWLWAIVPCRYEIIRYRIRKPRGLVMLERLIADLPAPRPKVREVLE